MIGVRFPEPWSSTSLAKNAVLTHCQEKFVLDRALTLIEGHPELLRATRVNAFVLTIPLRRRLYLKGAVKKVVRPLSAVMNVNPSSRVKQTS